MYFDELNLNNLVLDALDSMNFTVCTPVQEKAIPKILEGKDVLGIAQTGTGKTAAFLLPILSLLCDRKTELNSINCLIMTPTRELAQQIDRALEGFSYFLNISSLAIYGGNDGIRYEQEKRGLTQKANIIIATPGRLLSHISMGNVNFSTLSFFVLDEADRMLDMGFSEAILQIEKILPKQRQTILFSATMPNKILHLAKSIMRNPIDIKLEVSKPVEKIIQQCCFCSDSQKEILLPTFLKGKETEKIIIFASSKQKVKQIYRILKQTQFAVGEMHADLDQKERDKIIHAFKSTQINILIATNIIARGIDIENVSLVINYDVPLIAEDYIHRIGRTARANRQGESLTLVNEKDKKRFYTIEHFLGKKNVRIPLPQHLTIEVKDEITNTKTKKKNFFSKRRTPIKKQIK